MDVYVGELHFPRGCKKISPTQLMGGQTPARRNTVFARSPKSRLQHSQKTAKVPTVPSISRNYADTVLGIRLSYCMALVESFARGVSVVKSALGFDIEDFLFLSFT